MAGSRGNKTLKLLDRYLGIAVLAPGRLLVKRQPPTPGSIRRVGLMKTAAIGDTVLLAGLIDDVRRTFREADIVLITGNDNRAAFELISGRGDEYVVVSPRDPLGSIKRIRTANLDVIVDFGSWPRFDALLAALSGARYRVGFETPGQFRHYAFDRTVVHSRALHERDNYARLLAEIGVNAECPAELRAPGVLPASRLPPRPYVVFHAWSGGYMREVKEWPFDRWAKLAEWAASHRLHIVLSGSPAEAANTRALEEKLSTSRAVVTNAAGAYTLQELADVLAGSEAVVTVNTGVAHLSGLVGARTVCLEGPTPPARWRPLGARVRTVVTTTQGCGYLNLGFEYSGQRLDCMDGISVSAVVETLETLLRA